MSDYLSELARKNIGTADVIQPRRAARFEPLPTPLDAPAEPLFFHSKSFDLEQLLEDERSERKTDSRPRPTIFSRKNQLIPIRDDFDGQAPQIRLVSPAKTYSPINDQIDERFSIRSQMIEETRETPNEILSAPRQSLPTLETPKKSLLLTGDAREEPKMTVEHAPIQPRFEPKPVELKMPETKISEPQVVEREIVKTHTPIVAQPRVSKAKNYFEETTFNQTKISPTREKVSKPIAESASASNVPVINVTIGRVEVRAVASSAPLKETRTKPSTLSLDEYLRQRRSGGGR